MKKLIFAVAVGAILLASCNSSTTNYTEEEKALGDSLSIDFGKLNGAYGLMKVQEDLTNLPQYKDKKFSREEYLKAFELVMTTDTANIAFIRGLRDALTLYEAPAYFEKQYGIPVSAEQVVAAYREAFKGEAITYDSLTVLSNIYAERISRLEERMFAKKQAFAAEYIKNKLSDGYSEAESGLIYKINNPGIGEPPANYDYVNVSYKGTLIDGTVFDESQEGVDFPVGGVIPGFAEALTMLGEGGSGIFIIPAELAYGENGSGAIAPNETLVFEVAINKIQRAPSSVETPAAKVDNGTAGLEAEVEGSEP